jgi:hypothetical protein
MIIALLGAVAGGSYMIFGRKPRPPAGANAVNSWHEGSHAEGDINDVDNHVVHDPLQHHDIDAHVNHHIPVEHHDIDRAHVDHHIPVEQHNVQHELEVHHHDVHADQDQYHAEEVHEESEHHEEWYEPYFNFHNADDGGEMHHQGELGLYDMGFKGKNYLIW